MSILSHQDQGINVLLVDDEESFLEQAKIFIQREIDSTSLETVKSPKKALKKLKHNNYDLIVSDYLMPNINGIELLEKIRKEVEKEIPFIIITGRGGEEVAMKALNLGANRYLQKGRDPQSQYNVLARAIEQESERKRIKEELKREEKKFQEVFTKTYDSMWVVDVRDNEFFYEEANPQYYKFSGLEEGEVVGKCLKDLYCSKTVNKIKKDYEKVIEKREPIEKEQKLEFSGEEKYHLTTLSPLIDEYGKVDKIVGAGKDISERKFAEEKLRKSREKYKRVVENINDMIAMVNKEGEILYGNEKAHMEVLGYHIENLVGQNAFELFHTEDQEKVLRLFEEAWEKENLKKSFEARIRCKDGSYKWIKSSGRFLSDGRALIVSRNIQRRKEAEEREEFLHSLLRHDVRNKAQSVAGYLELLNDYDLHEEAEDYLKKAKIGIKDSIDLIEKVKTLRSLDEEEQLKQINIGSIIKKVINERESQAQEKGIKIEYEEIEQKVLGGSLLRELFSNLIENAIQHANCDLIKLSGRETEDRCIITVEDNGIGIPDQDKDMIFEKGFTDGKTSGSGLGMHLVKKIAETYDGNIKVKDSNLSGTRFEIHLLKA